MMKASMHVKLGTKLYSLCTTDFKLAHMGAEKTSFLSTVFLFDVTARI